MNEVDLAMINGFGAPVGPVTIGRQMSKWDLIDGLNFLADRYEKDIFRPTHRVLAGGHKF